LNVASWPDSLTTVFIRQIREQQQVCVATLVRIASRPRSNENHGANVFSTHGPISNCTYYGAGIGGFIDLRYRWQDEFGFYGTWRIRTPRERKASMPGLLHM
jgi:hypothetical protein